jgi:hypothetical protein
MKSTLSLLLFFLLTGCGTSTCCQWEGVDYWTPEDASAVQLKEYEDQVTFVGPAPERIGGRAIVVCPDRTRIKEIEHVGQRGLPEPTVQWLVASWTTYCDRAVKLLKKRNLFDQVEAQRVYDVDTFHADTAYVIWFYAFNPAGTQWYFLAKGSSERREIPLYLGIPEQDRIILWLKALYDLAKV